MALRGAGGTRGGLGTFVLGLALAGLGFVLFLSRVAVMTNLSALWGGHFGLVLLPIGAGVGILFLSARSRIGWLLTLGGLIAVAAGVIYNLTFFFLPTNIFKTVAMLGLIFAGFTLMFRSFRDGG